MRKASQDGGDSTSITSGIENETKKPGAGILKSTRNSIKRKVQHFSDDTANEPLLVKNKEKSEIEKQSAKLLLSRTKTDFACEKGDDKDKLLADDKIAKPSISEVTGITHGVPKGNGLKEQKISNLQSISTASIHNHMNANVFSNMEELKNSVVTKTQMLVELDTSKPTGYSPSPLIFTTAKIHTDGKMQQMEPVQVTPVPVLSTIEVGIVKIETKTKETSEKSKKSSDVLEIINKSDVEQQSKENKDITVTPLTTQVASLFKLPEKHEVNVTSTHNFLVSTSNKPAQSASGLSSDNKAEDATKLKHIGSDVGKNTTAQLPNINKLLKDEVLSTKVPQLSPESKDSTGSKVSSSTIKATDLTNFSKNIPSSTKIDIANKISSTASTMDKSYVDINKNDQSQSASDIVRKSENNKIDLKVVSTIPMNNISKIKEIDADSGIKDDFGKTNLNPISTTKSSKEDKKETNTNKSAIKEQAFSNVKSLSNEKSASKTTAMSNTINTTSKTMNSVSKITSPSFSSTDKSRAIDKAPLALSSQTISKETSSLIKPPTKTLAASENVPNVTKTASSSTPTLTNIRSKTPQSTSSSSSTQSKTKPTTDRSKTTSSGQIPDLTKTFTTEGKSTSTKLTSLNVGSTSAQITTANTASRSITIGNSVIKTSTTITPNNAATVVSSISKPTTTESGVKIQSSSNSSTGAEKSAPKHLPSTKTVPSGIPIVSSTVNAVLPDKTSLGTASGPVNKSMSLIKNNTKSASSTTKLASDHSSLGSSVLSSTAKPSSTSSTKTAVKNASQSESKPNVAVKDTKGSKA